MNNHRSYSARLLDRHPELSCCLAQIFAACDLLEASYHQGGKLMICGNGGSAADCDHIVGELMKGFRLRRPVPPALRCKLEQVPGDSQYIADHLQGALPAISLPSQGPLLLAFANDVAADMGFAQQVYGYGAPGDVVLGITTSGSSRNVLHALGVGRALELHTIGLTGASGGSMLPVCDVTICVPSEDVACIQEYHVAIYHAICADLEAAFFQE
jgi:phosphoheptose isomerase